MEHSTSNQVCSNVEQFDLVCLPQGQINKTRNLARMPVLLQPPDVKHRGSEPLPVQRSGNLSGFTVGRSLVLLCANNEPSGALAKVSIHGLCCDRVHLNGSGSIMELGQPRYNHVTLYLCSVRPIQFGSAWYCSDQLGAVGSQSVVIIELLEELSELPKGEGAYRRESSAAVALEHAVKRLHCCDQLAHLEMFQFEVCRCTRIHRESNISVPLVESQKKSHPVHCVISSRARVLARSVFSCIARGSTAIIICRFLASHVKLDGIL